MATPSTSVHIEPSVRSLREWTPSLYTAARAAADGGDLSLAADFCEAMMSDERVSSALKTRTLGIVGLPLSFEPAKGKKRPIKALEAEEDWWAAYPEQELARLLTWGILLVGIAQQEWVERNGRSLPKLKNWHPRHLRWDWETREWSILEEGNRRTKVAAGDGTWILYTPNGETRPWAFGAWRALALWYLLKLFALHDWANYSDRHGQGHLVAETPAEWTKEKRKEIANELYGLAGNSTIALPAGCTLKFLEAEADTYETFKAQIAMADMGMAIAILGQNLSTEVSGPVSTGASLHSRVLDTYVRGDAQTITTCIREQSLTWWAAFNFGNPELAPWPSYNTKPPSDRKANAEVYVQVATALNTLSNANAPIDVRAILESFEIPLKDIKDIEQSGQTFKYHLDYGVLTRNEIRSSLGLPPVKGGDEPPKPLISAPGSAPKPNDDDDDESSDDEDDEDDEDESDEDKPPPKKAWEITKSGSVMLRSGLRVRAASGFVQGQIYADEVADHARERAAKILDDDLVAVLEAVEGGASYDDIRQRLVSVYRGMSPDKLARLVEAAMTMAELGGRHAVNEDT